MTKKKTIQLIFIILTAPISIPILFLVGGLLLCIRLADKELYYSIKDDEYEKTGVY